MDEMREEHTLYATATQAAYDAFVDEVVREADPADALDFLPFAVIADVYKELIEEGTTHDPFAVWMRKGRCLIVAVNGEVS
jgi:hypothetical protein